MRRLLALLISISVPTLGLVACDDPNGALFADIQYGTDCVVTRGCMSQPNRDICGISGGEPCGGVEGTATLSCAVSEDGASRRLTFSATQNSGFGISVRQAIVPTGGGGAGGGGCTVTITEGVNRYVGRCGSAAPTATQPCQITDVRFYDDMGNATLEGSIRCEGLENQANPAQAIEVHAKGSSAMAVSSPGSFRIANCSGLEL